MNRLRDDVLITHEITVWQFVLNDLLTNGFVVKENDTGALAIVDPGARAEDLIDAAEEWGGDVRWILVTHHHGDHCAALETVAEEFEDAEVVGPPGGPFRPSRPVSGGESLEFGARSIQACATPGHSPESVSYEISPHVFVGDFLFRLGSGRTDGPGASTEDLFRVVRDVFEDMAADVVLWCGHGPPSTIGEERKRNPFWRIALEGAPGEAVGAVDYRGSRVPVLAWADDYDGGRKALLELDEGRRVIVPGSQVRVLE
ncbi:MAG: MBL fold metallo-hydrolase [Gemmatimonadetes bacterium]|nr:MBL fold metallo-hydrolase [Gemmatimonadota bacterium]